jgi:multicomponent K+:H+ antiporter subunit E
VRRLVPSPALSIALFLLWLLLEQSLGAGTILLGAGLALFWPLVTGRLAAGVREPRRPLVMARLFVRVIGDMSRSNAHVIWALLTRRATAIRSRFVQIPLELRDPGGLSVLAAIVTMTPGTAWVELSVDRRTLLIHVFHTDDEATVAKTIKERYERPLREIFE